MSIELEQLKHLVAFYEFKTLSKAATELHISQPVLTRSMKRIEEELKIKLFERSKNKIIFNETGLLAVELAKRLLNDYDNMKKQLIDFDKKKHTFAIGSCAPAPSIVLNQKAMRFFPEKSISSEIKDNNSLIAGLQDQTYTVIIMPYDIEDDQVGSIPFMDEQLYFSLPYDHPLAKQKSISLKEMDGQKMLLMSNIGFWSSIYQDKMANTKFYIQQDRNDFYDLIELSTLPSFTSSFTMEYDGMPKNRVIIPISDKEAKATFYCWYLKENEHSLASFLYHLN
ncbi:MAG: LysR family transcriptional regulator [Thomasclavelia sp.]